ncbi:unnamed protein product [Penicillium salamii]|uniref:RING-type domain-containing protein n=1 Tax=Penicillium salamii TaxID=1612424 RepID=A0A9W4JDF1_9EURO|nr:unnamed protein product [Penicillium salamii]
MPSRHYPTPSQPSLSLSEIIELEPEEEPWCAGYAPSQRRRCHIRTNSRGRSSAMALLDKGTEKLQAGRNIDNLLEDLAPHILCTRFHQNQASTLTSSWRRKVRSYLESQSSPTPSTRATSSMPRARLRARSISREPVDTIEATIACIRKRVEELVAAQSDRERTDSHSRETENSSRTVSPSRLGSSSGRHRSLESYTERVAERASTEVTVRLETEVPRPAQAHVAPPRRVSVSTQTPQSPSTVVSVPRRTEIHGRKNRLPQVTRREVEGDCGICLCDLHGPQQAVDSEDETDNDGDDDDEKDDSEDDEEEDDSEDDDDNYYDADEYQEELTWCKVRCGVNFHKKCIDRWLACARTCPACRSMWEDMN